MKKLKILLCLSPFFIMASCDDYFMIGSLNSFYTDDNVVEMPEIEGNWTAKPYHGNIGDSGNQIWKMADSTLTWSINRKKEGDNLTGKYLVRLKGDRADSLNYKFDMVIFKAGNDFYADFTPVSNLATDNSRLAYETNYPVHTLSKILHVNNQLIFSWLEDETMRVMIEEKRVRASFRWIKSSDRFVLTGSSKQLSEMIEKYCNQNRFVDWEKQSAMIYLTSIN